MKPRILVVDDEPSLRVVLSANLRREGYEPLQAASGEEAIELLSKETVHVLVTDLRMPGIDGMELLEYVSRAHPLVPVIMITAHGTVDTAVEAMKKGAFDYITKPFEQAELKLVVQKAVATSRLAHGRSLASGGAGRYGITGSTPSMKDIFQIIEKVADSPTTVLITGESGTGKELVSRALHETSSRSSRPFIRINCAAIPRDLIESELFGYEKGAFTGAVASKPGRFELANGGTLFLDEIGEIPVEMQVKLLRALQEQEFERVGGIRTIKVDVRLIAATNQNLEKAIQDGRFREDLYYRLNVVPIRMPALRERRGDIPALCEHIITKFNERLKRAVKSVGQGALDLFADYDWPGNIRELENVLERMILFSSGEVLTAAEVPAELKAACGAPPTPRARETESSHETLPAFTGVLDSAELVPLPAGGVGPLKELVRETTTRVEVAVIVKALEKTGGNVTRAADLLEISRKSLQNKMKEYGLRDANAPDEEE
ncbi:MAG: sigma-54-dependent Fis family transcriptional regulator [Myxococcales bacterium]|nr:sigma-54-dependent Fis family transcriptional regulator [Myxococcales bacterium]